MACRRVLEKFYIGDLRLAPGEEGILVEYEEDMQHGQFFTVLKERVEQHFQSNQFRRWGNG